MQQAALHAVALSLVSPQIIISGSRVLQSKGVLVSMCCALIRKGSSKALLACVAKPSNSSFMRYCSGSI